MEMINRITMKHTPIAPRFQAFLIPIRGILYFLSSPYLWWQALAWTMISLMLLGATFFTLLLSFWPSTSLSTTLYITQSSESIGYALLITLFLYICIFPIPNGIFYEKMLKKVLQDFNGTHVQEGMLVSLTSTVRVIYKTAFERIFWLFIPLLFLLFFPPIFPFLSFVGAGYITLIDAIDLSLAIQGVNAQSRIAFIKQSRIHLFLGGLITGIALFLFVFTLLGYIFLIPSIYVGSLLFVRLRDCNKTKSNV